MRFLLLLALGWALLPGRASAQSAPATPALDQLSPREQQNLARIQQIHAPGLGLIQRLRDSDLLTEDAEWWVAGPPEVLPFAGSWRGLEGVAEFQTRLGETMRYDTVELKQYLVSGEHVAAIFLGAGVARATGRPFRSEIVRLYTFHDGKIVRVRNYYDTAAYVAAVSRVP
ncbi:MAG: nuclear transport factor 2 family protein [Gemmatimonadota bacterium]|nr:nuclear transport factor 2 family protein [Gemmatimonadota bacterium]